MKTAEMISGFVDGIHGDEIVGWIANHGKARLLEPVILDGGSGEQMVFCPHYYRPDVAAAIGRAGIYGFAIPIGILPAGWMQIRLLTRFGDPLDQGELTLPNARHDITPAGLCHVFLHIQKTAGTSLRSALQNAIPASRQCLLYPSEPGLDLAQFNFLPFHQRTQFSLVAGHTYFGIHKYLGKSCRYITFIRKPMARLLSHYWHYRLAGDTSLKIGNAEVPLNVVVNEALTEEFDNYQVRILAGTAADAIPIGRLSYSEVELAFYNIRESFDFIGTVETLAEDVAPMFKKMNLPYAPLEKFNVTPYPENYAQDEIYQKLDWNKIEANNKYDLILYDLIQKYRAENQQ